ncbi:MAG: arabinofuranosidase catalytic domain-containing protein [Steroidobacteraceae bacterium]
MRAPRRPEGPCDVYAAAGDPCVAAYSTTRAMNASYNGPLYQIRRQSDGKFLNVGVVQAVAAPVADPGGYADAAAQDTFCADTSESTDSAPRALPWHRRSPELTPQVRSSPARGSR